MGVSRLSALIIAHGSVEALANGPNEDGKWQGVIAHGKEHPHHPYMPILSTGFVYENRDSAIKSMEGTVNEIRGHFGETQQGAGDGERQQDRP